MKKQSTVITPEKMQEIYTSEEFRNNVAHAHGCYDTVHNFKHYETCSYPDRYIVTKEQIEEAKAEKARAKAEKLEALGNKLVFVGMGMTYEPTRTNEIGNHRIRTEFQNPEGRNFFVEFSGTHVCFSIDRDMQREYETKLNEVSQERKKYGYNTDEYRELTKEVDKWLKQPYYHYKGLERTSLKENTKQHILEFINSNFDCNFTEIEIDNYTLGTDDFICVSPSK